VMYDIEALVLSGELFNGPSRPSSPARSPSPDAGWHDEELNLSGEEDQVEYDSDTARRTAFEKRLKEQDKQQSIGMGPGRTGVKGVIRDRDEAEEIQRDKRAREMDELKRRMEKSHLGGKTFLEEEREKTGEEKVDELVRKEREREEERRDVFGLKRTGKFGHLREVGVNGFLSAVEGEDKGVWVVVHLYDPSLERCYVLDDELTRLARAYPDTKFVHARASALGFASTSSASSSAALPRHTPSQFIDEDDDPYDEKDIDTDEEDGIDDDDVDLDVLPTMLVYRDGELVYNWVRVDWESGGAGIEELLDRHRVLPKPEFGLGNLGLPSDDGDDLLWSDDD